MCLMAFWWGWYSWDDHYRKSISGSIVFYKNYNMDTKPAPFEYLKFNGAFCCKGSQSINFFEAYRFILKIRPKTLWGIRPIFH